MPNTDGVIFDYGQTLATFEYPRDDLLEMIGNFRPTIEEVLGSAAPSAEVLLDDVLLPLERYVSSASEDEVDWSEVFKASWERAGLSLPDGLLSQIADAEQLCWDRIVQVDPDAVPVLSWLRAHGIKRALCSNAPFPPEMMLRQVTTNGIRPLMDAVVFSSMIGRRKPAPEMYMAALEAIGLEPDRVLFVGNRVREDYEGPVAAGMRAVILTSHTHEVPQDGVPTIASLSDLPSLV